MAGDVRRPKAAAQQLRGESRIKMETLVERFDPDEYIVTSTGNAISKSAIITGSQSIVLAGKTMVKPKAVLRGDLGPGGTAIQLGVGCIVEQGATLQPGVSSAVDAGGSQRPPARGEPLRIGAHVMIARGSVLSGATLGSNIHVGAGCEVGRGAVVRDNVALAPGTVVPAGAILAPFGVFAGAPAQRVGELPSGWADYWPGAMSERVARFVPAS